MDALHWYMIFLMISNCIMFFGRIYVMSVSTYPRRSIVREVKSPGTDITLLVVMILFFCLQFHIFTNY